MKDMANETEEVQTADETKEVQMADETKEVQMTDQTKEVQTADITEKGKQDARAFLRERFLRAVSGLRGQNAEFDMFDNTTVCAQFNCCDIDVQNIVVSNLKTPLGNIPNALLRTNDVYSIKFVELKGLD